MAEEQNVNLGADDGAVDTQNHNADQGKQTEVETKTFTTEECCLSIGISKHELFTYYYMDEIGEIIYEHNEMQKTTDTEEIAKEVGGEAFFGF